MISRGGPAEPSGVVGFYILLRQFLGIGLLILAAFLLGDRPAVVAEAPFWLAGLIFMAMGVSAALLRRFGETAAFRWAQLLGDTSFAALLVASTGGAVSAFFPLFFVNIVAAAWLLPGRAPLVIGAIDAVAYAGVLALTGLGPLRETLGGNPMSVWSQVALQVAGFALVAMLSDQLAAVARRARAQLEVQVGQTAALQAKHDVLLDQLDSGVVFTDAAGVITRANPWAVRVLGPIEGRVESHVLAVDGRRWEQAIGEGAERMRVLCSRTMLADGGAVTFVEDVSRLREMEERVAREEALLSVGRVAAGLAHEIRNPLASLSGSVQLMRELNPSPLHDIVLREVDRLNALVEEFLDASRPPRIVRAPVDAGLIIGDVATAFRNDPRFARRLLIRTHAQHLPLVPLDEPRVRQIVWNLLLNAAQATPDHGTVDLRVDIEGADLRLVVRDNGVGIPPDRLARIFDPYYTTRAGGTGLGLATVKRIVEAHGGRIQVDSTPNVGSTFTLRFPVIPADYTPAGATHVS